MDRLVDYFAVVGYDFENEDKDHALRGKVFVRIPETDWEDNPFTAGIEPFCQPAGWYLSKEKNPPTFFVAVFTDDKGNHQFCAVHSFSEPIRSNSPIHSSQSYRKGRANSINAGVGKASENTTELVNGLSNTELSHGDEYIDEYMCRVENEDMAEVSEINMDKNSKRDYKYAPKCLVLLSRIQDFRVLKNCLGVIYTIYIDNLSQSIENVIAKMLLIKVPPPGSTQLRFSIGTSDKQALQTPQTSQLPITRSSISMLLGQLGILNVLNILCAALIDQKLMFYSCSYIRLTEACNALTALMYPFKYSYPYIPILPHRLLECTSSPTPFLFGVHSSCKSELSELLDVITVDLDGGVISIPECVTLPVIPEPYYTSVVEALTKVLCPDLVVADWAYPPDQVRSSEPERLDKEIRAIFLRLFSQLLMGYRSCLQVCRIHPKPIIRFQKEQYLTMRGFDVTNASSSSEFVPKLLESQAFSLFVQDNGPPFRRLHIFDEVVAEAPERMQSDIDDVYEALKYNKRLASDLYINENPNHMPLSERIPKPTEGAYVRTTQRKFPKLSATAVQAFMEENREMMERERHSKHPKPQARKRVPEGMKQISSRSGGLNTSSRRLEVLKNCLTFIFESRTLEIKKIFQAVIRAMKSQVIRHALAQELGPYSKSHAQLDNQQFDYITRLINSALQDSSGKLDEYTLAADLLPLVTSFSRKLCPTVTQFIYSVVQDHPVWVSSAFWENAFFDNIQEEIQLLYKNSIKPDARSSRLKVVNSNSPSRLATGLSSGDSSRSGSPSVTAVRERRDNQLCMEIAAVELQQWGEKSPDEQKEVSKAEESVVFSQVMHNVQRMVCMLMPIESSRAARAKLIRSTVGEENSSNSYFTSSIQGSRNGSMEDLQFDDSTDSGTDISSFVSRFICKFVDRVCTEANVGNELVKSLLCKVADMVQMQKESLQDVSRESKRLPPPMKSKLLQPRLLTGESLAVDQPLRAYLAFDGRATATGGDIGGPSLLPAEGALFVTTYRVIFIGVPRDPLASEQVVIRSFPVSSLFKSKPFKVSDFPHMHDIDKDVQNGIQLRSSTFQLLLLGFDTEVDAQEQENLLNLLHNLRYPSTIEGAFAISSTLVANTSGVVMRNVSGSTTDHSSSQARMSAAKAIYKQAKRKAGLNKPNRFSRLITTDGKNKSLYSSSTIGATGSSSTLQRMPVIDETMSKTLSDKDTMNRLLQRSSDLDYRRMNLIGQEGTKFRLSRVNRLFGVCRSYPFCVIVPMSVSDDQIKSIAHCHQHSKFPAVVWIHPTSSAVLLRASSIRSRTANALFKHGQQKLSNEGVMGSSSEEERFLLTIASLLSSSNRPASLFRPESISSLASLDDENNFPASFARSGSTSLANSMRPMKGGGKKWNTLTRSNGKIAMESLNATPQVATRTIAAGLPSVNGNLTPTAIHRAMTRNVQLYVFIERSQLKNLRHEQSGKVIFVPVELADPKQIRTSFKSFLKACLPVDPPASASSSSSGSSSQQQQQQQNSTSIYLKGVQDSVWLEQVSLLIQAAGSIVDIMDIQRASVMLSIDDGVDVVPQLSSLSQLLMDAHYRTVAGFRTLVEKEWLSFGHRFSHRNRFNDIQSSGYTPVFLLFLDAVYQVYQQFPMSFEFNETYLEVLAYHVVSNRFTTFLLDSDYERLEAGILFEKKPKRKSPLRRALSSENCEAGTASFVNTSVQIKSFWEYVDAAHGRSPIFFNPLYCPSYLPSQILRPISALCRLKVWPYYLREVLGEGPSYDGLLGELSTGTSHNEQEATETSEAWGGATGRRLVNRCYDNIADAQPDSIKMLLNKMEGLQRELGHPIDTWNTGWKNITTETPYTRKLPDWTVQARSEVRSIHKHTTVSVIEKEAEPVEWQMTNRSRGVPSAILSSLVPHPGPHTAMPVSRDESEISTESSPQTSDVEFTPTQETFELPTAPVFRTSVVEVRTYEGALWKQGAFMKGWKLRFFVLDTTKHELRQYNSRGDIASKNIIDLKDLEVVQRIDNVSNPPKDSYANSYFEVRIAKRTYHFIAESEKAAEEWVDNLQATLQ